MARYIDIDKANIKQIPNFSKLCKLSSVREWLDNLPTVDVQEIKYGEWIDNHCSLCGMTPLGPEAWEHLGLTPPRYDWIMSYCPICGAKMTKLF
jgi:hypothetical protein